ncbi:MAG: hypothetical protein P1U63_01345 [Coxiellaceae bacterium]|nr:hypothetical protein [Coxiellaceae bacterium]
MPTLFSNLPTPDPQVTWDQYVEIVAILSDHFDNDSNPRPVSIREDARGSLDMLNDLVSHRSTASLNSRERAILIRGAILEGSTADEGHFCDQPEGVDELSSRGNSLISQILIDYNLLKSDERTSGGHVDFEKLGANSQHETDELHRARPTLLEPDATTAPSSP